MPPATQPQLRGAILENLLELLPVGVRIIDEHGTTIYANPAARQIWNGEKYVPAERWKAFRAWRAADNSPLDPGELAGARALRTGETVVREELEIEASDGARKVILKSAIPIADEAGVRCGAVTVNEDITGLKRIQQRQKISLILLEHWHVDAIPGLGFAIPPTVVNNHPPAGMSED